MNNFALRLVVSTINHLLCRDDEHDEPREEQEQDPAEGKQRVSEWLGNRAPCQAYHCQRFGHARVRFQNARRIGKRRLTFSCKL